MFGGISTVRTPVLILALVAISYAEFNLGEAVNKGFESAGNSIGGWLLLGIIVALVFVFLTRKKKKEVIK